MSLFRVATLALATLVWCVSPAWAQERMVTIAGKITARASGKPIAGALVTFTAPNDAAIVATKTAEDGRFTLVVPVRDGCRVVVRARGFQPVADYLSFVGAGPGPVDLALDVATGITEIGRILVHPSSGNDGEGSRRVSNADAARTGAIRVAGALQSVAGVTITGDAAAPGGDSYVSLRGLRPGESATLLDGHPIGPIGVQEDAPDADGTTAGFDYQDAPYFALRDIDVTFTSGERQAFGSGTLGGAVNLLTIEPTGSMKIDAQQGFGNEGRATSMVRATGSSGHFGFAFVDGVTGTYGSFSGGAIPQTGLRGTDLTSATLHSLTYDVSGDYVLRNEFAKIAYEPVSGRRIVFSAYDATSWADKTGEGDNDANPYAYVLGNAPIGASAQCPHGVLATTDAGPQCLSASAYAASASGPAGGGPGAWQALRNQDYDLHATEIAGPYFYGLDLFEDRYAVLYHRDASAISGPLDAFLNRWDTDGVSVNGEVASRTNTFGIGASWLRQTLDEDGTAADTSSFVRQPTTQRNDENAFVRDTVSIAPNVSIAARASLATSSIDARMHVDPQLVATYRPTSRDTVRVTANHSSEEPALQSPRVDLLPVGALNPDCGAIAQATATRPAAVNVGSGPAAGLAAENGTDLEVGFEHRFGGDSLASIDVYDTNVTGRIVTGDFAAGSQLPASTLGPLYARISQFCGVAPAPEVVTYTLSRSFNAATARLRGIELNGRSRVSRHFAVDYGYDVASIVLDDLPAGVLATDSTLVNGAQAFDVPLHKATLGVDAITSGGLEVTLEGHAVGPNNPQQLPGYAYADASLAKAVAKHLSLQLAVSNVFNSHAQIYGLVGLGLPYATNSYHEAISDPFAQPFNERYGLPPAAFTLSATAHL